MTPVSKLLKPPVNGSSDDLASPIDPGHTPMHALWLVLFYLSCYCCIQYVNVTILILGWIFILHHICLVCSIFSYFCLSKYHNSIIQTYINPFRVKITSMFLFSALFHFPLFTLTTVASMLLQHALYIVYIAAGVFVAGWIGNSISLEVQFSLSTNAHT
jgi:hypothetical protein